MLPEAIIFDWDNTLVDVQPALDFAFRNTCKDMGVKVTKKQSNRFSYSCRHEFLQDNFHDNWKEANKIYSQYIEKSAVGDVKLFKYAQEVLQFTFDNKITTVVVSNKFGTNLRTEINQFDLSKYFSSIIGSGDTEQDKPAALPAQTALMESGVRVDQGIWFIGDNANDMECARRIGATRILYGSINNYDIITEFQVQNHQQLLSLLQETSKQ